MGTLKTYLNKLNERFTSYVHLAGDTPDTVVQKKIWWLLNLFSVPILLMAVVFMGSTFGRGVFIANILFLFSLLLPLVVFHYHRRDIEAYALFSQLAIVGLTTVKVYLMGGMLNVGTPVYVGLIGPIYALILPNKKRAIYLFMGYTLAMITATLLNPRGDESYVFYRYFMGFLISNTAIFAALYYFTTQWERAKRAEKERFLELDALKTKFYTHIAHEFRTPLTLISGVADQMKRDPGRWLATGHDIIRRNSDKIISLTNQLLDLSKLEERSMSLQLIHDDVAMYTRYLVESFHSAATDKGIRLVFSSDPEEIFMDLDPDKFQEIVSNLVSNALKFTDEGGEVHVSLTALQVEGREQLKMEVRDTGIGIPLKEQHLVFNRYFQAGNHLDNGTTGSGIGLALSRELVHLMDGEISVRSAPGKGSIFRVTLPVRDQAAPVSVPFAPSNRSSQGLRDLQNSPEQEHRPKGPQRLHLLLVEDNRDVLNYLSLLLEKDYVVHTAQHGMEGWENALHHIPDLIISDVMMPGMDGFTLTRKLKEDLRTSHIPVVLLTARADADSRIEGLGIGADAYLSKPFNRQELFVVIENLIAIRKKLQQRFAAGGVPAAVPGDSPDGILGREDAFLGQVREVLNNHLDDEEFGIHQVCEALGMSRSQLYRKFAALTDTTVNQYLQNVRLDRARDLLRTTDLNVSEVAYDTGFKNPSHFSRAFSKRYGHAPSQARMNNPVS